MSPRKRNGVPSTDSAARPDSSENVTSSRFGLLRALTYRDFRIFFPAHCIALVSGWIQTVGQAWLVLQVTDSPLLLGLLGTLQFAPMLLLSIFAGAIADRLPKKRVLVCAQGVIALQAMMLGALVVADRVEYWQIATLALLLGVATTLEVPARQSYVAHIVSRDDIAHAVALNATAFNAARLIGPAIGGLLIGAIGIGAMFVLNGLAFMVVTALLLRLRAAGETLAGPRAAILREVIDGLRYARRTPRIVLAVALLFVVNFCVFNFTVYAPLLARHVLRLGPDGFGFLLATVGLGAAAGALVLGAYGRTEPSAPMMFGAAGIALAGLIALGVVQGTALMLLLLFATGFFGIVLVVSCHTLMQLSAPDALRGRIMSLLPLVSGGVFPVAAFLIGAISERSSVSVALVSAGSFGLAALAAIAIWWGSRPVKESARF